MRDTAADNGSPSGDGLVTPDKPVTADGPVSADKPVTADGPKTADGSVTVDVPFFFKMAWLDGASTDSCDITRDMLKSIDECAATFLVNLH